MHKQDEISFNQILILFSRRWRYLVVLALAFSLIALVKHKYFPQYPGNGKLLIKDAKNSQMQMLISSMVSNNGVEGSEGKNGEITERAKLLIQTFDFYTDLSKYLYQLKEKHFALDKLFKSFQIESIDSERMQYMANYLSRTIDVDSEKNGVLRISTKTNNKELTVVLINSMLEVAKNRLVLREIHDLNTAEEYFLSEMSIVKKRLDDIEKNTIAKLQHNQILSFDGEKGDSFKYISELRKNINDLSIQKNANELKIAQLKKQVARIPLAEDGGLSKFSETAQIRNLEGQNKELDIEIKSLDNYLKTFEKDKIGLVPMQFEIQKMNTGHDFEYKLYVSLNDSLSKIGLQKTYAKNRVEILERERESRVVSSPPLIIMVLISLTASQIIGIFSIYIYELIKPTRVEELS